MFQAVIPQNTRLCFKIVAGLALAENTFHGQSQADWSAIYAQFTIPHAVSYLSNHFDRGHKDASLVCITTKKPMTAYIFTNKEFQDPNIGSAPKATLVREALQTLDPSKPLLQSIGEGLENSFLVLYDATEFECVFPHALISDPANFQVEYICSFSADPMASWKIQSIKIGEETLKLTKYEKEDVTEAARKLNELIQPNTSSWDVSQYIPH